MITGTLNVIITVVFFMAFGAVIAYGAVKFKEWYKNRTAKKG